MPTYADVYCAGFINRQTLPDANYVAGGLETPSTTKFVRGDIVYLRGAGYSAGAEYEIVRALRDINEYEMFPGQRKLLKATGQPYEEVGRVRIIDTRSKDRGRRRSNTPAILSIRAIRQFLSPRRSWCRFTRRFVLTASCLPAARFPAAS